MREIIMTNTQKTFYLKEVLEAGTSTHLGAALVGLVAASGPEERASINQTTYFGGKSRWFMVDVFGHSGFETVFNQPIKYLYKYSYKVLIFQDQWPLQTA